MHGIFSLRNMIQLLRMTPDVLCWANTGSATSAPTLKRCFVLKDWNIARRNKRRDDYEERFRTKDRAAHFRVICPRPDAINAGNNVSRASEILLCVWRSRWSASYLTFMKTMIKLQMAYIKLWWTAWKSMKRDIRKLRAAKVGRRWVVMTHFFLFLHLKCFSFFCSKGPNHDFFATFFSVVKGKIHNKKKNDFPMSHSWAFCSVWNTKRSHANTPNDSRWTG